MFLKVKMQLVWRLGLLNLLRVFIYRTTLKFGFHPVQKLCPTVLVGDFFREVKPGLRSLKPNQAWQNGARLFGKHPIVIESEPPNWHLNSLSAKESSHKNLDWWKIPDFDAGLGDIKVIWELSRFDWVIAMSQRARQGDSSELQRLNHWLKDWVNKNAPYKGANWKCGQEASIRLIHLAAAALILDQVENASDALKNLLTLHLERIAPTVSYAVAQDNNHGTSEAAALFIGGTWLQKYDHPKGEKWANSARSWLENRAKRLISKDGSFSQYSLNYHRLMLDTFSFVEVWRRHLNLPNMSKTWEQRSLAATYWLFNMTNSFNGDAPNVGANDGAQLLQLSSADYRDYRPSVQLAMTLFDGKKAYPDVDANNSMLSWLNLDIPQETHAPALSALMDQGGYCVIRKQQNMLMLRYPRFRFRPSQADALHLDLWLRGQNILCDAGTFSYSTDDKYLSYFPGTASHNTVQFDDRDQMPRLSRFLFGGWLKTNSFSGLFKHSDGEYISAGYTDNHGASHLRSVLLKDNSLRVVDEIRGFKNRAVLRWRLQQDDWSLEGSKLFNKTRTISVLFESSMILKKVSLVDGWNSLYYQDKHKIPVLEIEVNESGTVTTEFSWSL